MARQRTRACDACYAKKSGGYCNACEGKYREANRERYKTRSRKRSKRRRKESPDYVKSKILQTRYGISLEERNAMEVTQSGKCLICNEIPKRLVVDHCHTSGKVRGLLCDHCNTGLGRFKDSPELLMAAIRYLKK
ncbi:MAG: endonuclease VII domain-containing protein [Betaproteobacteria bacterium]